MKAIRGVLAALYCLVLLAAAVGLSWYGHELSHTPGINRTMWGFLGTFALVFIAPIIVVVSGGVLGVWMSNKLFPRTT